MEHNEIIKQVNNEYNLSIDTVRQKREVFRERYKLYNDQNKDTNKISINLIYATMQAILWTTYEDEITVEFLGRTQADMESTVMWNALAKFDQEEMWLDIIYHKLQKNRALTWVWIRTINQWNERTQTPTCSVIDTLTWIPDPMWSYNAQNFRWHWFELQTTKYNLKNNNNYFNVDNIQSQVEEETQRTNTEQKDNAWLNFQEEKLDTWDNSLCNIYHHYTTLNWKKYWIALANNRSVLIWMIELPAVLDVEKEDPSLIPFPIVLNYYDPQEWNPYWNSMVDLLEDKQRAQSKYANLMMQKATREALWNNILYDKNLIPNRIDLTRPTQWPKLIWIDWSKWPINWAMAEIQTASVPASSFNMFDFIQQNAFVASWLDSRSLWVAVDRNITATEAQQIQANANLRSILLNKVNFRWEKSFWELWYREYKWNFKKEKYIRIKEWLWMKAINIKQDKFDTKIDPDIVIKSKANVLVKKRQEAANLMALLPLIQQNPNIPEISKLIYLRTILINNWISQETVEIYVPNTVDEVKAKEEVHLLNENELREPLIWSLEEDHLSYIIIYQQALNTNAKWTAIQARREAYKQSWQAKRQNMMAWWEEMSNMAWNQLMSNAISNNNKDVVSRWDIIE